MPDDFTVELWRSYIDELILHHRFDPNSDILILDGIPRNVGQARIMEEHIDMRRLYYLDCADKELMSLRLKRRALRENRLDDASDIVIKNRLYVYEAETAPVVHFYPTEKVVRIDTGQLPIQVLAEIISDMKSVAADH